MVAGEKWHGPRLKRNERGSFPFCVPKKEERGGSGELVEMMTFLHGHMLGPDAKIRDLKFLKIVRPCSELDMNSCRHHFCSKDPMKFLDMKKLSAVFGNWNTALY